MLWLYSKLYSLKWRRRSYKTNTKIIIKFKKNNEEGEVIGQI